MYRYTSPDGRAAALGSHFTVQTIDGFRCVELGDSLISGLGGFQLIQQGLLLVRDSLRFQELAFEVGFIGFSSTEIHCILGWVAPTSATPETGAVLSRWCRSCRLDLLSTDCRNAAPIVGRTGTWIFSICRKFSHTIRRAVYTTDTPEAVDEGFAPFFFFFFFFFVFFLLLLRVLGLPFRRDNGDASAAEHWWRRRSSGGGGGGGGGGAEEEAGVHKGGSAEAGDRRAHAHREGTQLQDRAPKGAPLRRRRGADRPTKIAECLVGDETGTIIFTARNDQVDLMKPEATVILRNAKIDMFKGSMRLAVDKWGRIEVTDPTTFVVKEDNNISLVEYELVNVVEE
uniref:Single-stranded DNA binding protein Ssb-like OB fold domain-containing protein n=1 Tax=Ananas comosus var. bracteatus TaxID=296719 RepID=A0A6V7NYY7_ANACO|nr:unnamed protein product [Ananas comosus var. bracteatus]